MRDVKSELEDKGKFETFLNILSEQNIDNLFDYDKLQKGYLDNDSFYMLNEYNEYKKGILSEYINSDINDLYQNFNKSFMSFWDFINKYFSAVGQPTRGYSLDSKIKLKKLETLAKDFGEKYKVFIRKTVKYLSYQQEKHELEPTKKTRMAAPPVLVTEEEFAYLKIKNKKIKIGNIQNAQRKYGLLKALAGDCFGKKRAVNAVFELMELPKDQKNSRLQDDYTALRSKKEIILMTWKEIQRILNQNKLNKVFTLHLKGTIAQFDWI